MGFADLLRHLGTLAANTVVASLQGQHSFALYTRKTQLQEAAFELFGFDPARLQQRKTIAGRKPSRINTLQPSITQTSG